jgi:integrase
VRKLGDVVSKTRLSGSEAACDPPPRGSAPDSWPHQTAARYKVCLTTIYSCGLRLQKGTNLRVADIDSARLMIHVRHGKSAKDRYVPLPQRTLLKHEALKTTEPRPLLSCSHCRALTLWRPIAPRGRAP